MCASCGKRGVVAIVAICLLAVVLSASVALAQEASGESKGGSVKLMYVIPYFVVIICFGMGMFAVCAPSRRRERPRDIDYKPAGLADTIEKSQEVPLIVPGMHIDQVIRKLGKPNVARTGADLYRELFERGMLSEEEAEKEYYTWVHPAGRYELVVHDKRVIQVIKQPRKLEEDEQPPQKK